VFFPEVRMQEREFMGIGNKPFMDIQPSDAAISDRAVSYPMLGRGERTPGALHREASWLLLLLRLIRVILSRRCREPGAALDGLERFTGRAPRGAAPICGFGMQLVFLGKRLSGGICAWAQVEGGRRGGPRRIRVPSWSSGRGRPGPREWDPQLIVWVAHRWPTCGLWFIEGGRSDGTPRNLPTPSYQRDPIRFAEAAGYRVSRLFFCFIPLRWGQRSEVRELTACLNPSIHHVLSPPQWTAPSRRGRAWAASAAPASASTLQPGGRWRTPASPRRRPDPPKEPRRRSPPSQRPDRKTGPGIRCVARCRALTGHVVKDLSLKYVIYQYLINNVFMTQVQNTSVGKSTEVWPVIRSYRWV